MHFALALVYPVPVNFNPNQYLFYVQKIDLKCGKR